MKSLFLIIFSIFFQLAVIAQSQEQKIKEFEQQRNTTDQLRQRAQLDSTISLSEQGYYEEADEKFRMLLKLTKSVSSDLVFHFGKNSFLAGKNKQSVDWLNKYLQLKGTTGQYSEEAVEWLRKAETELMKEKQIQSQQAAVVLSKDFDIDCGPTGKVTCPVCKGSTVIIKKGYIEDTYRTCPYCNKMGYLECHEYNLLLKGQLEPSGTKP